MKHTKKSLLFICCILFLSLTLPAFCPQSINTVEAASKVKLNKTKLSLTTGKTYQLKVSGTKKKVKWSSSKKSVASVSSKGKITAKKKGTATITAKVSGKNYKCRVTVKNKSISCTYYSKLTMQGKIKKIKNPYTGANAYILVLDYPVYIKYREDGFGTIKGTYTSIDLSITPQQYRKYANKRVKVTGNIIYGMTQHYITDFALFNVKIK